MFAVTGIGIGPGSLSSPNAVKTIGSALCCDPTTKYGMPMLDPLYRPEPKSGCKPMPEPTKLMIAAEFESTGAEEISLFQRLSAGNGTNPFRLALWPRLIPLQLGGGFPPIVEVTCRF